MNLPNAAKRLGCKAGWLRRNLEKVRAEGLQCHREGSGAHWRIDPDSIDLVLMRRGVAVEHRQVLLGETLNA